MITIPEQRVIDSVETFSTHLDTKAEAYRVRTHDGVVDFTIGDPDLWPRYGHNDHLQVIRSSTVDFDSFHPEKKGLASPSNPQMGMNIHFPPAEYDLWGDLQDAADFSAAFTLLEGTFELGEPISSSEGVCTPYLVITEDVAVDAVIETVDEAFRLYEDIYDGGAKIIKKRP